MRAYRFLSKEYGIRAIKEKRIKISLLSELNDPFEWAAPTSSDSKHRRAFEELKEARNSNRGVVCFSSHWNNPLMWSHYAEKHSGIALGFELSDDLFFKMKYRLSRVRCDWDRLLSDEDYGIEILRKVMSSKFSNWSYEEEIRGHVHLDPNTRENGIYFLNFGDSLELREVIVGSNCDYSEVENAIKKTNDLVKLSKARLAFNSFRVVPQHNRTLW